MHRRAGQHTKHGLGISICSLTRCLAPGSTDLKYLQKYLVSLAFSAHLVGFGAVSSLFGPVLNRLSHFIRWTAGATFTIYLFHVPLCQLLTVLAPWSPSSWYTRLVMFPGALAMMFVIAELTERRKQVWHRLFSGLFGLKSQREAVVTPVQ